MHRQLSRAVRPVRKRRRPPDRSTGVIAEFKRKVSVDWLGRFVYSFFIAFSGFGCVTQTHGVKNLCLAVIKVVLADLTLGETLIQDAKLFEQRVLIGSIGTVVFLLRSGLSVADGLLFSFPLFLPEFALSLLV